MTPNWIIDVIEKEHYNLAEHHLYGSARLGIKGYWPNQLYSLWDYSDTSNIIIDTTLLQSRQAWYSAMYQDGIRPDVVEPWNSTFTNPAAMQTIIGQKQYEQTDHLGNVVITASDKKYAIADISDSVITAYHAELPSTYDYYPFGMLMPGRYTSDTSTQCATITQTVLVPTVTTYTDALTAAAALNISPTALSNVTNTTINVATTAANQGITLALANVELLKDNSFELTVDRIPTGLEYIAEVYEYNLNDTVLLTSIAIDRDATFTLTFKPSGSGNLGLVLKTVNALSSSSTTKFKNFYTTVTTYTAQSITSTICNTGGDRYRCGFNGQEKTNEIAGIGNHNTALFWEYDTRLARRWNIDPVDQIEISNYATFRNNPVLFCDILGDKIKFTGFTNFHDSRRFMYGEAVWNRLVKFLQENGLGDDINTLINSTTEYEVKFISPEDYIANPEEAGPKFLQPKTKMDGVVPTLYLDLTKAMRTERNDYIMSPMEVANHEIGHAATWERNPLMSFIFGKMKGGDYGSYLEQRNIQGPEQIAAKKIGTLSGNELTRTDHKGELIDAKYYDGEVPWQGLTDKENKRAEKGMNYSNGGASNSSGDGSSDVKDKGTIGLQTGNNGVVQYPGGPNK